MVIRDIRASDIDGIYNLYHLEGWKYFSKELIDSLSVSSRWVVVEEDNKIIGVARYLTDNNITVFLCEIIVSEENRRRGIGSAIIDEIFNRHVDLRIDVLSDADEFYDSLRFRHLGKAYRKYRNE